MSQKSNSSLLHAEATEPKHTAKPDPVPGELVLMNGHAVAVRAEPAIEEQVFETYCTLAKNLGLSQPKLLSKERMGKIRTIHRAHGTEGFQCAFDQIQGSKFLQGKCGGWKVTFDWLLAPANFLKIIEGNYEVGQLFRGNGSSATVEALLKVRNRPDERDQRARAVCALAERGK